MGFWNKNKPKVERSDEEKRALLNSIQQDENELISLLDSDIKLKKNELTILNSVKKGLSKKGLENLSVEEFEVLYERIGEFEKELQNIGNTEAEEHLPQEGVTLENIRGKLRNLISN